MKKILLMLVVLITGTANAQDTFNFRCIPAEELAIAAMYAAEYSPSSLDESINNAANIANDYSVETQNKSRRDFISLFDNYGLVFTQFNQNANGYVVQYADSAIPDILIPGGGTSLTNATMQAWALAIAQTIWLYGHPNYDPLGGELQALYDADTPPTELGPETIAAATAAYNVNTNAVITNFIFDLDDKSTSRVTLVNSNNGATYVVLDNNEDIEANRIYSPNKVTLVAGGIELDEYKGLVFNVVEALYYAQHPEVVAAELRAERIADLDALDKDGVNVEVANDALSTLVYPGTDKSAGFYFLVENHGNGNGKIEDLDETTAYADYKAAIIAKRDEIIIDITPTVAKELDAFATGNEPTGSAPEWLPTALYASANTNTNGTKRTAFLVSLSGHGVSVTHILGDANLVTHFRISTGDGYDHIINWAPYTSGGWNQMTAESFRRLAFDVIVLKWKKIHETHNTERSDILDQTLDTDDVDVILITYADDWWIYFNNTGVPILSGGRPLDPMFHNKFTLNPHDTYMTEAEFQKLVVFVTYMRDNYTRLKAINGTFNRNIEISNLTDEFGVGISVTNDGGSYHYTFSKNGNSNEYPVQSNWTHAAGTTLGGLDADSWVKFYAKCRGIIIGL